MVFSEVSQPSLKAIEQPQQNSSKSEQPTSVIVNYHDSAKTIVEIAQNLLHYKKYDEAILQLKSNPIATLEDPKAAALLIKLYIFKSNFIEAKKVVMRSLSSFPQNIEIKRLWAQILFLTNKYLEAKSVLEENNPSVAQHLDYYSF